MKGTWFQMVPERRSQMACGISHSRFHHRLLTDSIIGAANCPLSDTVEGDEGSNGNFALALGEPSEEGVLLESGLFAESSPAAPGPVLVLVAFFLSRVQDNSAVSNASKMKEEISLGRGEMTKSRGISCGAKS